MSTPAYALSDFGSYTVGGRAVEIEGQAIREIHFTPTASYRYDPNGTFPIEHLYVQYFVPAERNSEPPIILLHGGGMSGVTWETTPDGRPGWLHLLLQRGFEVHVVDGVERGRAGWCAVPNIWPDDAIQRSMQEAWTLFRFGQADGFAERRAHQGQQFPVDNLEAFARTFVPRWTSTTEAAIAAFMTLIDRLGRSIVVCHSQGGEIAFNAAMRAPDKVEALCALEPSGFAREPASMATIPTMFVLGDYCHDDARWTKLSAQCRQWHNAIAASGGASRLIELPESGITGNSHMMMMDSNNEAVLDLVLGELSRRPWRP